MRWRRRRSRSAGLAWRASQRLARPVVGIQATPDGKGYWEVAGDGGIFAFDTAQFSSSMAGQALSGPVVGVVAGWASASTGAGPAGDSPRQ